MAVPWAAIAQAADSVVGGVVGYFNQKSANETNRQINADQLAAAYQMQQNDLNFQRQMWNMTNEYNTPSNQAKLWREAGFNPYLTMANNQGVSAASQQTGSGGSVPSALGVQPADLSPLQGMFTESLLAQSAYRKANAEADMSEFDRDHQLDKLLADLRSVEENTHYTRERRLQAKAERLYFQAVKKDRQLQEHDNAMITGQQLQQIKDYNSLQSFRRAAAEIGVRISRAQEKQIYQSIRESVQRIVESRDRMLTNGVSRAKMRQEIKVLVQDEAEKITRNKMLDFEEKNQPKQFQKNLDLIQSEIQHNLRIEFGLGPLRLPATQHLGDYSGAYYLSE